MCWVRYSTERKRCFCSLAHNLLVTKYESIRFIANFCQIAPSKRLILVLISTEISTKIYFDNVDLSK